MTARHPERRTARLRLRQWSEADLDALAEMDADPDVMRYIGDGSTGTRERTAAALGRVHAAWDEHGYGLFAAEETATGELVGWVGLAVPAFLPEVMPAVEIGWRLRRRPGVAATPRKPHARSWRSPSVRRSRTPAWNASSASATSTTTPRSAS